MVLQGVWDLSQKIAKFFHHHYHNRTIVPIQFYNVRKRSKPKADVHTTNVLTAFVYGVVVATFVALFVSEKNSSTTETIIQTSAISSDSWSCQMASIVTTSYLANGSKSSEVTEFYDFVNLSELESDCLFTLNTLDPCSGTTNNTLLFDPGAATPITQYTIVSATAYATMELALLYVQVTSGYRIALFNASSGYYQNLEAVVQFNHRSSAFYSTSLIALSKNYYEAGHLSPDELDYFYVGSSALNFINSKVYEVVMLTNDNLFTPYAFVRNLTSGNSNHYAVLAIITLSSVNTGLPISRNITIEPESWSAFAVYRNLSLMQSSCNTSSSTILSLENYLEDCGVSIYYLNNHGGVYKYGNESVPSVELVAPNSFYSASQSFNTLVLSQGGRSLYMSLQQVAAGIYVYHIETKMLQHLTTNAEAAVLRGLALLSDTRLLYNVVALDYNLVGEWYFFDLATNETEVIYQSYLHATIGWFTCGEDLQANGLPSSGNLAASSCFRNGLSWQMQYQNPPNYYLTQAAMKHFMEMTVAYPLCNTDDTNVSTTLYSSICNKVADLPPYLCTSQKHAGAFAVLSIAVANSHLLGVILFVTIGMVLPSCLTSQSLDEDETRKRHEQVDSESVSSSVRGSHQHDGTHYEEGYGREMIGARNRASAQATGDVVNPVHHH